MCGRGAKPASTKTTVSVRFVCLFVCCDCAVVFRNARLGAVCARQRRRSVRCAAAHRRRRQRKRSHNAKVQGYERPCARARAPACGQASAPRGTRCAEHRPLFFFYSLFPFFFSFVCVIRTLHATRAANEALTRACAKLAGKGGKNRRRGKNTNMERRELTFKEEGQGARVRSGAAATSGD